MTPKITQNEVLGPPWTPLGTLRAPQGAQGAHAGAFETFGGQNVTKIGIQHEAQHPPKLVLTCFYTFLRRIVTKPDLTLTPKEAIM